MKQFTYISMSLSVSLLLSDMGIFLFIGLIVLASNRVLFSLFVCELSLSESFSSDVTLKSVSCSYLTKLNVIHVIILYLYNFFYSFKYNTK